MTSPSRSLVDLVVRFCSALRRRGIPVPSADGAVAARVLECVDLGDRDEVRIALRTLLVTRVEDVAAFDDEFERTFSAGGTALRHGNRRSADVPAPGLLRRRPPATMLERCLKATGREEPDRWASVPRPSENEPRRGHDPRDLDAADLASLTRIARRMARRLATRPSRRVRPTTRGVRVHIRRTMRRMLETGGAAATLAYRERRPRRTKLLVMCDVSGSMDLYARFLLQLLYALARTFARVETFLFATRLSRVTGLLRQPQYGAALDAIARHVRDFSGGTRIGVNLDRIERERRAWIDRRTTVIVLSDGWDTGDPALLGDALARLRRRAGRVIWLNPLLGSPGYQPLTRALHAALPHVDLFHPADDVASLESLVRHLTP